MLLRNQTWRPAAIAFLALALLAVIVSGCGGSDESDALKKSDFIAQANAICMNAEDEREQGTKDLEGNDGSDRSEEAGLVAEALIAPVAGMTEELSELGPPTGEGEQVREMVRAFEAGVSSLEAEPASADTASALSKASRLATEYGLTECSI